MRQCRGMAQLPDNSALDFFDYAPACREAVRSSRARRTAKPSGKSDDPPIRVVDDWPGLVPITEAEIRVVEAHLGDVLDELFGRLP